MVLLQEICIRSLDREQLRTSKEVTVETLKKFLGKKLSSARWKGFDIMALTTQNRKEQAAVILNNELTIAEILKYFKDKKQMLVLHYRMV
jgi:hypothetical protein